MKKFLLVVLLFDLMATGHTQDYFSSSMIYGEYKVGFKEVYTTDLSRPSLTDSEKTGREMQLRIWYPATAKNENPVLYKEYIALHLPREKRNATAIREVFFKSIAELSGDTSLFTSVYEKLVNSGTKAYKNLPVAKGNFPLLIYSDNVHAQTVLCEYLASHGFIIVSPVIKGAFSPPVEYTIAGIETGVADMQFALAYIRSHFNVKRDFSVMGIGFNATLALAMQMRNKDVRAMISLEGGITTGFEDALIQRTPYFNLAHCTAAMLIIHAPHPDVKPELTYKYKFAERVYQHYPQSSEFYFLNYGLWEKKLKNIFPKANRGNTWQSFEMAALSVKNFLNWKLNSREMAGDELLTSKSQWTQTTIKSAALLPPSYEELVAKIGPGNMDDVAALYNERKKTDPQPFPFSSFYRVGQHLIQQTMYKQLTDWAKLFEDSYPSSAIPYSLQGRANLELGNKAAAKIFYERALSLLANDNELSENEKSVLKPAIENRIRSLETIKPEQ